MWADLTAVLPTDHGGTSPAPHTQRKHLRITSQRLLCSDPPHWSMASSVDGYPIATMSMVVAIAR